MGNPKCLAPPQTSTESEQFNIVNLLRLDHKSPDSTKEWGFLH